MFTASNTVEQMISIPPRSLMTSQRPCCTGDAWLISARQPVTLPCNTVERFTYGHGALCLTT